MEITRNLPGGWGVGSEAFLESSVRPWNSDYKGPHGLNVTHYRHRHRHHHDHQNIHFHCYRSSVRTRDTNTAQACHQSKHILKFGICDQCRTMSIFVTKDSIFGINCDQRHCINDNCVSYEIGLFSLLLSTATARTSTIQRFPHRC